MVVGEAEHQQEICPLRGKASLERRLVQLADLRLIEELRAHRRTLSAIEPARRD